MAIGRPAAWQALGSRALSAERRTTMRIGFELTWHCICSVLMVVAALLPSSAGEAGATYGREGKLGALSLNQTELATVVLKVQDLVERANADGDPYVFRSFELTDGTVTFSVREKLSRDVLKFDLQVAYAVRFHYSAQGRPISGVTIYLQDWARTLKVEGNDSSQVDALFALASQEFSRHTTWLGAPAKAAAVGILWLAAFFFWSVTIGKGASAFPPAWMRAPGVVLVIALAVAVMFEPFGPVFPSVAVYAGDASFLARHSAAVSAIGTAATLFGIVLSVLLARGRGSDQPPEDREAASGGGDQPAA